MHVNIQTLFLKHFAEMRGTPGPRHFWLIFKTQLNWSAGSKWTCSVRHNLFIFIAYVQKNLKESSCFLLFFSAEIHMLWHFNSDIYALSLFLPCGKGQVTFLQRFVNVSCQQSAVKMDQIVSSEGLCRTLTIRSLNNPLAFTKFDLPTALQNTFYLKKTTYNHDDKSQLHKYKYKF